MVASNNVFALPSLPPGESIVSNVGEISEKARSTADTAAKETGDKAQSTATTAAKEVGEKTKSAVTAAADTVRSILPGKSQKAEAATDA